MVTVRQDFFTELRTMEKSGNSEAMRERLLAEMAALIGDHKESVIEAMQASGVLIPSSSSTRRVVDSLVQNLPTNKRLQSGMAYLMADRNELLGEEASGGGGDAVAGTAAGAAGGAGLGPVDVVAGTAAGAAGGAGLGPVGAIIGGITGAIGSIFSAKAAKEQRAAQEDANRVALLQILANRGKTSNTGLYIALGVVGVLAVVGIIILARKK